MRKLLQRLKRDMRGNIMVMVGAGASVMIGGAGLGVDTVQWYLWKRQLQQAVDSGALAGALALSQGGGYDTAVRSDLTANANTTVTVESISNPPATGAWTGNTNAVEVIATTSRALPFSSLFLSSAPIIRARAVAASASAGEHCVIALASTGTGISVPGSADVQLGCGVAANSEGSKAIDLSGTSMLEASPLSSVGGISATPDNYPAGTDLQPYGPPQADPLAGRGLTVPTTPSVCKANSFQTQPSEVVSITPGRFCNGMALKGDVTMAPGVYIIDRGSFQVNSQARVRGNGVTIVLTGSATNNIATVDIMGGATVNLKAPTAAQDPYWRSILFFQDPRASESANNIAGGSTLELEGVLYMRRGNLDFTGNSGQHTECLLIVANRVSLSGTTQLDNDCPTDYSDINLSSRRVRVVE